MKAIVITKPGGPEVLVSTERSDPRCEPDQVIVAVKAAGINRPDVFQRKGNYPPPPGVVKDIPGLEIAGIVVEVGADVKQWRIGDRVCALVAGGGYAERIAVFAEQCLPIPTKLSFVEAAALPETVFTVWSNVFMRGGLQAGEKLLVHGGSSGIGTTAIQLATALGASVFATAGTPEKCQACLDLGAVQCVNYQAEDFETAFQGLSFDVILDMIGGTYFDKNIRLMAEEGRLVYINAIQGQEVMLNISQMMRKRITITGSTLRNRDRNFKSMLSQEIGAKVWPLIETGKFTPLVYQTFPLDEAFRAHELMESSQHIGKIVLEV